MCGSLVVLAGASSRGGLSGQVSYHLGRGVGYIALGACAGLVGDEIGRYIRMIALPRSWALYLGIPVVVTVLVLFMFRRIGRPQPEVLRIGVGGERGVRARLSSMPCALGVFTSVLPCPWLYSFVTLAGVVGEPLLGAQVMGVFWLGTLPALLVVGTVFEGGLRGLLKRFPHLAKVSLAVALLLSVLAHFAHRLTQ